jgi:hypothetical protein
MESTGETAKQPKKWKKKQKGELQSEVIGMDRAEAFDKQDPMQLLQDKFFRTESKRVLVNGESVQEAHQLINTASVGETLETSDDFMSQFVKPEPLAEAELTKMWDSLTQEEQAHIGGKDNFTQQMAQLQGEDKLRKEALLISAIEKATGRNLLEESDTNSELS